MTIQSHRAASGFKFSNLGELELRILEVLWQRPHLDARQVRDSLSCGRAPSLNRVQSALERLFRKQYIDRIRHGQAYSYFSAVSRSALLGCMLGNVMQWLHDGKMETILSSFVHVAADPDECFLDELEALIKARRDAGDD